MRCSAPASAVEGTGKLEDAKQQLLQQLEGINRGIFGVKAADEQTINDSISRLEQLNPRPEPLQDLSQLSGRCAMRVVPGPHTYPRPHAQEAAGSCTGKWFCVVTRVGSSLAG